MGTGAVGIVDASDTAENKIKIIKLDLNSKLEMNLKLLGLSPKLRKSSKIRTASVASGVPTRSATS